MKGDSNPGFDAFSTSVSPEHNVCKQLALNHLFPVCIMIITLCVVPIIHQKECINMHVNAVSHSGIGSRGVLCVVCRSSRQGYACR